MLELTLPLILTGSLPLISKISLIPTQLYLHPSEFLSQLLLLLDQLLSLLSQLLLHLLVPHLLVSQLSLQLLYFTGELPHSLMIPL